MFQGITVYIIFEKNYRFFVYGLNELRQLYNIIKCEKFCGQISFTGIRKDYDNILSGVFL